MTFEAAALIEMRKNSALFPWPSSRVSCLLSYEQFLVIPIRSYSIKIFFKPMMIEISGRPIGPDHQGRLKVFSTRARCHASQCEHSP